MPLDDANIGTDFLEQRQGSKTLEQALGDWAGFFDELYKEWINKEKQLAEIKSKAIKDQYEMDAGYRKKQQKAQDEYQKAMEKAKTDGNKAEAEAAEATRKAALKAIEEEYSKRSLANTRIREAMLDASKAAAKELEGTIFGKGNGIAERISGLKQVLQGGWGGAAMVTNMLGNYAASLEGQINQIAGYQGIVNTRLQGSSYDRGLGSWDNINRTVRGVSAASPFLQQSQLQQNVVSMIRQGIAFNVEQRAFLQTIKDKIADTFDANNGTLLRLIRIQQQDTTAARLGMESALTAFLNNMYSTTEYMTGAAKSVKSSLGESMALMSGQNASAFEFQVQKWMGSLSSVGMSDEAVGGIASALGQLAAGQIDGLNGSGYGNLMVMAANRAGLSIADILQSGLSDSGANQLLGALASYLGDVYGQTGNSQVVRQQFANVFGLKASDLRAAANLSDSLGSVGGYNLGYSGMLGRLREMSSFGNL